MTTLSTHVLDLAHGRPAEGVAVSLLRGTMQIAAGLTDGDGRCPWLGQTDVARGQYSLRFSVAAYYRASGIALPEPPFLDDVTIVFGLADDGHYHVPLLVSPFGYSTYRGS